MIAHFPDPYPDELLYSTFARLFDRMRPRSKKAFAVHLFGMPEIANVDFVSCLDSLLDNLPKGHVYTVESLLAKHTMFPFYSALIGPRKARSIRDEMRKHTNFLFVHELNFFFNGLASPYMGVCPVCVEHDRLQFGEAYWHRSHQPLIVDICPLHEVWLLYSNLGISSRRNLRKSGYKSLEAVLEISKPLPIDPVTQPVHKPYIEIARDAQWLLTNHNISIDTNCINDRYQQEFSRKFEHLEWKWGYIKERKKHIRSRYLCDYFQSVTWGFILHWFDYNSFKLSNWEVPLVQILAANFLEISYADLAQNCIREGPY